jgi:mandelamide amidase
MTEIEKVSILELSVRELADRIRKRELTCVEVATAFLANIEAKKHLNAMIYVNSEQVLADAKQLDQEADAGSFRGPLHGVPLCIRDNIHIKGIPNTAGSPALKHFVPDQDAPVVTRLKEAGYLLLAKTNMHEFAFGVTSNNKEFGRVGNAHDPEYSAGGSSGGTGSAVGAHLAPAGLGSDTGGSVRIPASVNGIAGLRPTRGRYSGEGVTPMTHERDTVGPMARTVDDLILLDEVLTGQKFASSITSLRGVRLGVSNDFFCSNLDPEVSVAFERTKSILKSAGVELVEVEFQEAIKLHDACGWIILANGMKRDLASYLSQYKTGRSLAEVYEQLGSPDVKKIFSEHIIADKFTAEQFDEAVNVTRPAFIQAFREVFSKNNIKALVFPTLPCMPIKFADVDDNVVDKFIRNSSPCSVSGMPGLSIPMNDASDRLPIGLELNGLENSDHDILMLGKLVQDLLKGELDLISF